MAASGDRWSQTVADNRNIAVVEDTAVAAQNGGTKGTIHVTVDGGATGATLATTDSGPTWTVTRTVTTSADMQTPVAIGPAPGVGNLSVGDDIIVSVDGATTFTLQEETSATVFAIFYMAANQTVQITPRDGFKTAVANKKFFGKTSGAVNITVTLMTHVPG